MATNISNDTLIQNHLAFISETDTKENHVENLTNTTENSNKKDNNTLIISEKSKKVFLPYKESEVNSYLQQYPDQYRSFEDVVNKEFILPIENYIKNFVVSRFRETYTLIRDREAKSIMDALKYSVELMFKRNLNPAIIAACKTQAQLENYLDCLERGHLEQFEDFKIVFEVNPL